jgi:hypothetical protein
LWKAYTIILTGRKYIDHYLVLTHTHRHTCLENTRIKTIICLQWIRQVQNHFPGAKAFQTLGSLLASRDRISFFSYTF